MVDGSGANAGGMAMPKLLDGMKCAAMASGTNDAWPKLTIGIDHVTHVDLLHPGEVMLGESPAKSDDFLDTDVAMEWSVVMVWVDGAMVAEGSETTW